MNIEDFEKVEAIVNEIRYLEDDHKRFQNMINRDSSLSLNTSNGGLVIHDKEFANKIMTTIDSMFFDEVEKLKNELKKI